MSLKAFHVVFVVASIALAVFYGVWSTQAYLGTGGAFNLAMAVSSFASVGILGWYGVWFLKKLKGVSYL